MAQFVDVCSKCKRDVTSPVKIFSLRKYGKILCYSCQKKADQEYYENLQGHAQRQAEMNRENYDEDQLEQSLKEGGRE